MRKVKEILRQKLELRRSNRDIAASVGKSAGVVSTTLTRATAAGLDWATANALSDDELEAQLYGQRPSCRSNRPLPDAAQIHLELRRTGVTLELLHLEYLERNPDGFKYTKFCEVYREWCERRTPTMRQVHVAGEKCFVDYSGKRPHIVDSTTGEWIDVELFVGVLGASNFTFARATRTQQVHDFVGAHLVMFERFEGVPKMIVPDQLKSGVTKPCWYEPAVQRTYEEMAQHYGTVVVPARPRHPRDKAKVEVAVQVAQRWILARLRNETFCSLEALNDRIDELCADMNARKMKTYGASRRELFDRYEREALSELPPTRYECAEFAWPKMNVDYHVDFEGHHYSVPFQQNRERVEVRATFTTVEILLRGKRIASHPRSRVRGGFSTKPEHMPSSHRAHAEWSPSRLLDWAASVGPSTAQLVDAILRDRPHPEQGYRSCLGILRLSKKYGNNRLEAACASALGLGARSYRHVESMLMHGLDRLKESNDEGTTAPRRPTHANVRGRDYYH
jgi:transposase